MRHSCIHAEYQCGNPRHIPVHHGAVPTPAKERVQRPTGVHHDGLAVARGLHADGRPASYDVRRAIWTVLHRLRHHGGNALARPVPPAPLPPHDHVLPPVGGHLVHGACCHHHVIATVPETGNDVFRNHLPCSVYHIEAAVPACGLSTDTSSVYRIIRAIILQQIKLLYELFKFDNHDFNTPCLSYSESNCETVQEILSGNCL